ncbi:MAG TPA: 16S rRNA (cytosine(967)-C(5))-methyltransferase RsmB [Gemmatimonadaceae bacterium]|nr:16S rRNA (cytosine(967)-C(5))-methyltransferase RsmB [Gemmatimonadaceae bacterium]
MKNDEARGGTSTALPEGKVTESRVAAAEILADLRRGELVDAAMQRHSIRLDWRDRRWLQELIYGTLRNRERIDAVLATRVRGGLARLDADLRDTLRLGAYQLLYMGSVPSYAAIAQTVELAKARHGIGAGGLVNAVLRRLDRERDSLEDPAATAVDSIERLVLTYSHPRWLVMRWVERWGEAVAEQLLAANNREAAVYLRPFGVELAELQKLLDESEIHYVGCELVPDSLRLSSSVNLTELGAFKQGFFFVQDPAATLVTRYASFEPGSLVVDVCAAPGGKSLELARSHVVIAADRSQSRIRRLAENVGRLRASNVELVVMDAGSPALRPVTSVLLDAPCTGTGTFRRHPDARWRLKPADIAVSSAVQRNLLEGAAAAVAPGGLLVYSTCSLEPEENEAQVEWFLGEHDGWVLEPPPKGAVPEDVLDGLYLRVLPHVHGVDGAFAARLRRRR